MLRYFFLFLLILWIIPRLFRFVGRMIAMIAGGRGHLGHTAAKDSSRRRPDDHLQDLTQQDISDAEFEEIPPEE